MQMRKNLVHFITCQNHWQPNRLLRTLHIFQPADLLLEHFLIEEKKSTECLILSRSRHVTIARQMRQKRAHLCLAHFARMPQIMEPNEPLDPIAISPLGAQAVMLQPHHIAHLIEQFFRLAQSRLDR